VCGGVLLLKGETGGGRGEKVEWVERWYRSGIRLLSLKDNLWVENLEVWLPFWQHFENLKSRYSPEEYEHIGMEPPSVENTPLGVYCVLRVKRFLAWKITSLEELCRGLVADFRCMVPRYERPFATYENRARVYVHYDLPEENLVILFTMNFSEEGYRPRLVCENVWQDHPSLSWRTDGAGFFDIVGVDYLDPFQQLVPEFLSSEFGGLLRENSG
jgi:hypothetical protein